MNGDAVIIQTLYAQTCKRCHKTYESKFRARGVCSDCKEWFKATRLTHCHRAECCDPSNPTRFDRVKNTRYGPEYHCPKFKSWINFGLLAEVFSITKE